MRAESKVKENLKHVSVSANLALEAPRVSLPEPFAGWFRARGWRPHAHQLELLDKVAGGRDALLIAPTGGGKTLAGFLPSLVDLAHREATPRLAARPTIHTLYVSPLKALAVDIARNLSTPIEEMELPISLETRTGDTPPSRRARQRISPPDILLTTPEQIALMLSHHDAAKLFGSLKIVIFDELHALASSKRGDLLALDLARLRTYSPNLTAIGLSATVARPYELAAFLVPHKGQTTTRLAEIVTAGEGAKADISILKSKAELPSAGHSARYALPEIYEAIKAHRMSLMFVNTRSQAEMLFHELWRYNDANLAIALHHGSLDVAQRRKVEAAMVAARPGAIDVLAQHVLGTACASSFDPDQLYREVVSASPYQGLTRESFDKVVEFVATGGYALAIYERYAKLERALDGRYRIAHPRIAQQYRLNVGTIVEPAARSARSKNISSSSSCPATASCSQVRF